MRKKLTVSAATFLLGATVLLVFGYNLWSYCCGRCSAATFLTLGPFGYSMIAVNLLAAGLLASLRGRRQARDRGQGCSCGAALAADWHFCPCCGRYAAGRAS